MQTKGCQTEKQHSTCRRTQPERSVAKWRQCDDTWSVVYQSVVIHVSKKQLKNIEKFQILSDNGPILTLASSARWSAPTVHLNFRGRGRAPSPSPLSKIQLKAQVTVYPRSRERANRIGKNFACGSHLMI